MISIDVLEMSIRTYNYLVRAGVETLDDITADILGGCGPKTAAEILALLGTGASCEYSAE